MSGKSYTERARALRPYIEQASKSLTDSDAAKAVELFPRWADHIGETVKPGDRRSDTDESGVLHVYRVNKGQGRRTPPLPCGRSSTSTTRARKMTRFRPLVVWNTPMVFITKTPRTLSCTCASVQVSSPATKSLFSICRTSLWGSISRR